LEQDHNVIHLLGKKWSLPIMTELYVNQELRFNQLKQIFKKITPTTLSSILKELESNEIIQRKQNPKLLQSISYSLTDYGKELHRLSSTVKEYSKIKNNNSKEIPDIAVLSIDGHLFREIVSLNHSEINSKKNISMIVEELIQKGIKNIKDNMIKSIVTPAATLSLLTASICLNHGIRHIMHTTNIF